MMERMKTILLCLLLLVTLTACGNTQPVEEPVNYSKSTDTLENAVNPSAVSLSDTLLYYVSKKEQQEQIIAYDLANKDVQNFGSAFASEEHVMRTAQIKEGGLVVFSYKEDTQLLFYLSQYGADGIEVWKTEITKQLKESDLDSLYSLAVDDAGTIYLQNGLNYVCVWDKNGAFQNVSRSEAWLNGLMPYENSVYAYAQTQDDNYLQSLQGKSWEKEKSKNLPGARGSNLCVLGMDADGRFLINTGLEMKKYDIKNKAATSVFGWAEYGLSNEDIFAWNEVNGKYYMVVGNDETVQLATLSDEGEVKQKEVITINSSGADGYIAKAISAFNEQNDRYMVKIIKDGDGNILSQIEKRDMEIVAGNGTDLISMPGMQQYRKYADKGILEELYAYFDADSEIDRQDYLANVLQAFERNDKLYGITPDFMISTVIAPKKYVGDSMAVTIEEFEALVDSLPEEIKLLPPLSKDKRMLFAWMLQVSYEQFIDYEAYTCDFESEDFISWISFINSIPLEEPVTDLSQLNPNDYLFGTRVINDESSYQCEKIRYRNENVTYMGYPGSGQCGSYLMNTTAVGIWSQSDKKEGAWEFIKFLLSEEQQDTLRQQEFPSFPVNVRSMEKNLAHAMETEYMTDDTGKEVEKPKGEAILWSGEKVPYYAASKEEMDQMRQLITSVTQVHDSAMGVELFEIILEELAPYYEGDKSAQEAASFIQNRVQLYLNEKKE